MAAAQCSSPGNAKETKAERKMREQYDRPAEQLAPLLTVKGDALDPAITISTINVTATAEPRMFGLYMDETSYLRGFVDKKTGEITAQIYDTETSDDWKFFRTASYSIGGGELKQADVLRLSSSVDCYRSPCAHMEDVAVPVPFGELEAAAAAYDAGHPAAGALSYRLFGQNGARVDAVIPANEIKAFVEKARLVAAGVRSGQPR